MPIGPFKEVTPSAMDAAKDMSLFHFIREHLPFLKSVELQVDLRGGSEGILKLELMNPQHPSEMTWKVETPAYALRSQNKYEYVARLCCLMCNPGWNTSHLGSVTTYNYEDKG